MFGFRQESSRTTLEKSPLDGQRALSDGSKISYQQISPTERPSFSNTTSPPNSASSNESLHMLPWGKRHGSKNHTPLESDNISLESTSYSSSCNSMENVGAGDIEFGRMTPLRRLPGGKMMALQGRTLESLSGFWSESSERWDMQSFQSDISYELLDQPRISDSSTSSTTSVSAVSRNLIHDS